MHAMLLRFSSYIPVLILKSQRLKFSHTNIFSQINKFFVCCTNQHRKRRKPTLSDNLEDHDVGRSNVYPIWVATWDRFFRQQVNTVMTVDLVGIGYMYVRI